MIFLFPSSDPIPLIWSCKVRWWRTIIFVLDLLQTCNLVFSNYGVILKNIFPTITRPFNLVQWYSNQGRWWNYLPLLRKSSSSAKSCAPTISYVDRAAINVLTLSAPALLKDRNSLAAKAICFLFRLNVWHWWLSPFSKYYPWPDIPMGQQAKMGLLLKYIVWVVRYLLHSAFICRTRCFFCGSLFLL